MCIWGWFAQIQFRVKRGNLWPIMISLRTGKSFIILGFPKILELSVMNHPHRAIAIGWLNVAHIWLGCLSSTTDPSLLYLSWILLWPLGGHIIKPSFPLVFPVTFDLIFLCSSVCFDRCLLLPTCLQPIPIHIAVSPMNLLRQTHYSYTGTTPTSYHKVF